MIMVAVRHIMREPVARTQATMAEQTGSPQSGQERIARPEGSQDERWQREMTFAPFEGVIGLSSRKEVPGRSLARAAQRWLDVPNVEGGLLDLMAGTSAMKAPVEKHAAFMSDPRFLHPANGERCSRLVSRMHETYGNAHVQRVIDRIQRERLPEATGSPVAQRGGLLETVGGWFGIAPEPRIIAGPEPEEESERPGPEIPAVEAGEAPAAEPEAVQPSGGAGTEGGPVAQLRDRGYLVNPENPVTPVTWSRWSERPRTRQLRAAAPAAAAAAQTELDTQTAEQKRIREELAAARAEFERLESRLQEIPRGERGSATTDTPAGPVPLGQRIRELRDRTIPRLRSRDRSLTYEINATRRELEEARGLQQETPPASLGNPNAVEVNLNHSGVNVRQKNGRQQDTSEWRLDPAFALAMADYLEEIRSLGVTDLYNQGFLREPESPDDTHPQGLAVDICGFMVHGHRLELSHDDAESAWFNTSDTVPQLGKTYREVMVDLANRMTRHFGQILGPGFNAMHMNHFHVQLHAARRGDETLRAPGTPENPRPFERRR